MLVDGNTAPDVTLAMDDGTSVKLLKLNGKPIVVYFYPKDDTPGCTAQAKDFSCLAADFEAAGARIIGVSPDPITSHQTFRKRYDLQIGLASDKNKSLAEAFGVWVEKSMYGKTYMGVERSTFLLDKAGKVARSWRKVKVPGHAEEVLAAARALKT